MGAKYIDVAYDLEHQTGLPETPFTVANFETNRNQDEWMMHINEYEQICKKYLVAQVSSKTNEKRWRPDASLSRHEKAIKTFARNSTYRANLGTREAIPIWHVESIGVEFANRLPMAWKQISPAQILANTCGAIVCLPKLRNMQLCPDFRKCYCRTLSQNHIQKRGVFQKCMPRLVFRVRAHDNPQTIQTFAWMEHWEGI